MSDAFDIAIIGSGFAGSLMGILAQQTGRRVVLIERERHPRWVIGESSTPLANLLLESLAERPGLQWLGNFSKWGPWQRNHPEIGCGLKRGFSFFHHLAGKPWPNDSQRRCQLLVAASPNDAIADTHWHRPDFDLFLQQKAVAAGCDYVDETRLEAPIRRDGVWELEGTRPGGRFRCQARWILDASGPRGFLHRTLPVPESHFPGMPSTVGVWSHFTGVHRWEAVQPGFDAAPFPPDDAALHHVFEDGWMWILRFNNGITSAGFVVDGSRFPIPASESPEAVWRQLLHRLPSVAPCFRDAEPIRPFRVQSPLPYRAGRVVGEGWLMLPMAAGFVDPLFSTGFVLSLLGIQRLGRWLEADECPTHLEAYAADTLGDLDHTAALIAAAHRCFGDPQSFEAVSMLYFAAASFSECALRLGKPELAPGFLLRKHPSFGPAFRDFLHHAGLASGPELARMAGRIAAPFNVAGLCDSEKRGWYPAKASDLLAASRLLESDPDEILAMLRRCGMSD